MFFLFVCLSDCKYLLFHGVSDTLAVADPEGVWGGSNEPPLETELFHFHGEFQKKTGQTAQIEPPQLI